MMAHPPASGDASPGTPEAETGASDLTSLDELIAEIAHLQEVIMEDLLVRRKSLRRELAEVESEIAEMTGEPAAVKKTPASSAPAALRQVTLEELVAELEAAPGRTINIRKAHLDSKEIKALAKAHPQLLKMGGKGSWPTVSLGKRPRAKGTETKAGEAHPDLFAFGDPADEAR